MLSDRARAVYDRLDDQPRKLKDLRLRGDTRGLIQPALELLNAGMIERVQQGREYLYRRRYESHVFHAPDALPDEQPGDYAIRVAEAYKEWLAVPLDPLPALVRNLVEVWADAGEDAACEVLRRWLDQDKNH